MSDAQPLFDLTPRCQNYTKEQTLGPVSAQSSGRMASEHDLASRELCDGPIEIEHVIGYTGKSPRTFLAMPGDKGKFVKAMGSIAVIGDLDDPHAQKLLRAHDESISALAISQDGSLLASGQNGSTHIPGFAAPVVVWNTLTQTALFKLSGLTRRVAILEFSDDTRFLAAVGEDCVLYIWDTASGEVVFGKRYTKQLSLFQWIGTQDCGRRRVYRLATAVCGIAEVDHAELSFDATRQQWQLATAPVVMPAAGMARNYQCSALATYDMGEGRECAEKYLLAGTMEGDLVVMRLAETRKQTKLDITRSGGVYRASVPICSGGMLALALSPMALSGERPAVFAGGGDGIVRKVIGYDMRWKLDSETQLDGAIVALSFVHGSAELLVGTDTGRTYRLLSEDLTQPAVALTVSHVDVPTAIAFGARPDLVATAATDGEVIIWDLSDYSAVATTKRPYQKDAPRPKAARRIAKFGDGARCLCWVTDVAVVVGYGDCHVRCFNSSHGRLDWTIPTAHRHAVSAIACWVETKLAYLVTGSLDGSVRVWNISNPRLFHSAGSDCAIFTHSLEMERRTVSHMMRQGAFTGLTQRIDSEQELVTCDASGRVLFWDCDVAEPILVMNVEGQSITCIAISPSGKYFALCRDEMLTIFQFSTLATAPPRPIAEGWAHSAVVKSVQWSPDERQLVSIGTDACICVWNFFASVST
mmetsp:Transcript_31645/g.97815  ORF Transcript_31645/g.97815 Transcript_31645/m.97815 type:complete len:700 (+) Transcript_31645:71-2170(+)